MPYLLEEKARQEGEKIREEKGSKAKAIEIAKALKQKEINITIIAETAGLSIEEVKTL